MVIKILSVIFLLQSVQSAHDDFNPVTWNMQGADGPISKWLLISYMLYDQFDHHIIAVQEAGPMDAFGVQHQIPNPPVQNPDNINYNLVSYFYNFGTSTRPRNAYIYMLETDPNGHRVNLAFVTREPVHAVIVLPSNSAAPGRPAMGIVYGPENDTFFNIHALSSGGSDAPSLALRIYQFMGSIIPWMLMGDFNRVPSSFMTGLRQRSAIAADSVATLHQRFPTHRAGGNYDYAVISNWLQRNHRSIRRASAVSDHNPVFFPGNSTYCINEK